MTDFPYYLREPGADRLRITRRGLEQYGPRYARLGIDLRQVRTEADAEAAWQAGVRHAIQSFAQDAKGRCPELDQIFSTLPGWADS